MAVWSEVRADSTERWLTEEEKDQGKIAPGKEDKVVASVAEGGLHESQVGRVHSVPGLDLRHRSLTSFGSLPRENEKGTSKI